MVCRIADNPALDRLRSDIGAERLCHSQRIDCVHRLPRADEKGYYGIAGAFLGYCQALFSLERPYSANTNRIIRLLESKALPWARSHELFYGHKGSATVGDFVTEAAAPLRTLGRVPILITGLSPSSDCTALREIFNAPAEVVPGETILVRMIVQDDESFAALEALVRGLVEDALRHRAMPRWWPLVQSGGTAKQWYDLRKRLGPLWSYMNVAVNPFSPNAHWEAVADQIMVAQFVVPHERDIERDGNVRLSEGMSISGASAGETYNIRHLVQRAGALATWPTSIFLGPTLDAWSDSDNLRRVTKAVRIFKDEIESLWSRSGQSRYSQLLEMAA
jgi:hypothetical protein